MVVKNIVKKTLKVAIVLGLVAVAASGVWVNRQLKLYAGGYTEVVDRSQFKVSAGPILITNVSVLSPDGERMIRGQSVFLNNGEISIIALNIPEADLPNNVLNIDGTGQFLIPGLMDGHVHLGQRANDLLLYFANGITHVRDMSGTESVLEMREQEKDGHVGPDMYISSEIILSDPGLKGVFREWTRTRINIAKVGRVEAEIKNLADQGYDALKTGGHTTDAIHRALRDAGKKYNLEVLGHLHMSTGLQGLWEGGQSEISHVEEIVKGMIQDFGGYNSENADEFLSYIGKNSDVVAIKLREHGVAVTSTLWLIESIPRQKFDLEVALDRLGSQLRYVDPGNLEGTVLVRGWLPGHNRYQLTSETENDPVALEESRIYWDTYVSAIQLMTAAMARNMVTLMAGTDTGTPIVVSGFSLHDELGSLAASGLSNAETLRSATATPALWLNENTGKISPGYRANLILLEDSPLESIGATRSILAVIKDGEYYDREKLDAMLSAVAKANSGARNISIKKFE